MPQHKHAAPPGHTLDVLAWTVSSCYLRLTSIYIISTRKYLVSKANPYFKKLTYIQKSKIIKYWNSTCSKLCLQFFFGWHIQSDWRDLHQRMRALVKKFVTIYVSDSTQDALTPVDTTSYIISCWVQKTVNNNRIYTVSLYLTSAPSPWMKIILTAIQLKLC